MEYILFNFPSKKHYWEIDSKSKSYYQSYQEALIIYPNVAIIILNWNGWKDTIECLESLYQITYPNYTVVLVDNGSVDDSRDQIRAYCGGKIKVESTFFEYSSKNKPINIIEYSQEEAEAGEGKLDEFRNIPSNQKMILIKNEKNYGFAKGNNIGIRFALQVLHPKYFLLLNNDTVVDRSFLKNLILKAEIEPHAGFIGPKIFYYDYQGHRNVINQAGGRIDFWRGKSHHIGDKESDSGQYDSEQWVDYLTGACILVRSSVIKDIGLLNPDYFLYWEETDWCMRGKRAGFKSLYVSSARIWHKIGKSSPNSITEYYSSRNRIWFMRDNAPSLQLYIFFLYYFSYNLWRLSLSRLIDHKNVSLFFALMKGTVDGVKINRYQ